MATFTKYAPVRKENTTPFGTSLIRSQVLVISYTGLLRYVHLQQVSIQIERWTD